MLRLSELLKLEIKCICYLKIIGREVLHYRENKRKFFPFKVDSPFMKLIIFTFLEFQIWLQIIECVGGVKIKWPIVILRRDSLLSLLRFQFLTGKKHLGVRILVARVFLRTWQIQNTSRSGLSLSFTYMGPLVPLSGHAPKEIQKRLKRISPIYLSYWRSVYIYRAM